MAAATSSQPLTVDTQEPPDLVSCLEGRFKNLHPIGHGSSGLVFAGHDSVNGREVAVKRLVFANQRCCRQGLREVFLLRKMQHDNIVPIFDLLDSKGNAIQVVENVTGFSLSSAFLVQELLDVNLNMLIQSHQLTPEHSKLIIYQVLRALKYIHSANVLHRDMKPSNVLVNCDTLLVKIADFGLARIIDPSYSHQGFLTEQVGSCGYRSPELIIDPSHYTKTIDMWAAGCILAEMILSQPIFPGSHDVDQLFHIVDTLHLSEGEWSQVLGVMPNKMLKNHPMRPRHSLQSRFTHTADPQLLDMLERLLTFDPTQRISAEEALRLPYLEEYHANYDEPIAETPFYIENEVDDLQETTLQELVLDQPPSTLTCGAIYLPLPAETPDHTDSSPSPPSPPSTTDLPLPSPPPSRGSFLLSGGVLSQDNSPRGSLGSVWEVPHPSDQSSNDGADSDGAESLLTLEEILHFPASESQAGDADDSPALLSGGGISPQAHVALKNLRNTRSCESLAGSPAQSNSPNIFDIRGCVGELSGSCWIKSRENSQDDEKEVADVSEQKLLEDRELEDLLIELSVGCDNLYNKHLHGDVGDNGSGVGGEVGRGKSKGSDNLTAQSYDSEAEELSSSDSNRSRSRLTRSDDTSEKPKQSELFVSHKEKEDYQATLTASRKLILDKIESEKASKEESRHFHNDLSGEELDELYRLPTDHLRQNQSDHDLSNARLKRALQKTTTRDEIKERLYEDFYVEGACGGVDNLPSDDMLTTHSHPSISPIHLSDEDSNVVHLEILGPTTNTIITCHNDIAQYTTRHCQQLPNSISPARAAVDTHVPREVSSSPETPASPRGRQCGARPKKSPKKQRAL